jgi:hypothetical protein
VKAAELLRFGFALVVGWTDPEGRRPYLGALLLAYYDPDGRLVYAGRAGTGINTVELERLWRRLQPLATDTMPLDVPPPRTSRFGSPLVLSRVHWVRPELVAEVKFLTWTDDNLLREVAYKGLREDSACAARHTQCRTSPRSPWFAPDSPLEGGGFEPPVPRPRRHPSATANHLASYHLDRSPLLRKGGPERSNGGLQK